MSGGINQVKCTAFTIAAGIGQAYALALDGDTPFPLNIHGVQHLIAEMPLVYQAGVFNEAIRQGGFAMVNVGNNTEVSDMNHGSLSLVAGKGNGGSPGDHIQS